MQMQDAMPAGQQTEVRLLLAAYHVLELEAKAQAAAARGETAAHVEADCASTDSQESAVDDDSENSSAGWVPRLREVQGVEAVQLGPLHGQLIALGLLKFQLSGRTSGMLYRLAPEGRALLHRSKASEDTPSADVSAA
jgi:hypothetical protein